MGPEKCVNCGQMQKPLFTSFFCDCAPPVAPTYTVYLTCLKCGNEAFKIKRRPKDGERLQSKDTDIVGIEGEVVRCKSCHEPVSQVNLDTVYIYDLEPADAQVAANIRHVVLNPYAGNLGAKSLIPSVGGTQHPPGPQGGPYLPHFAPVPCLHPNIKQMHGNNVCADCLYIFTP